MYLKIWCLIYYMYIVLHLLNHNVDTCIVIQRNYLNITETRNTVDNLGLLSKCSN